MARIILVRYPAVNFDFYESSMTPHLKVKVPLQNKLKNGT